MTDRVMDFDDQADTYDQRVGMPERHCRAIARSVLATAEAKPGDLIVEIGAGTGMIGIWLAQHNSRYIGLDLSRRMLERFRLRLACAGERLLLQADCSRPWPLADATAKVIFASRALHLLDSRHVTRECLRLACRDGARLIIGRFERPKDSLAARMRHEMQARLRQCGFKAKQGERSHRQLMDSCQRHGAEILDDVVAIRRKVRRAPWHLIADWQEKPGLAGIDLPDDVKRPILADLRTWANAAFGGLRREFEWEEAYLVQGIRLRPGGGL